MAYQSIWVKLYKRISTYSAAFFYFCYIVLWSRVDAILSKASSIFWLSRAEVSWNGISLFYLIQSFINA